MGIISLFGLLCLTFRQITKLYDMENPLIKSATSMQGLPQHVAEGLEL